MHFFTSFDIKSVSVHEEAGVLMWKENLTFSAEKLYECTWVIKVLQNAMQKLNSRLGLVKKEVDFHLTCS